MSASLPVADMLTVSPLAAPNIIRPMIDVPTTHVSSLQTSIREAKPPDSFANLADALACNPRRLQIVTSRDTVSVVGVNALTPKHLAGNIDVF